MTLRTARLTLSQETLGNLTQDLTRKAGMIVGTEGPPACLTCSDMPHSVAPTCVTTACP
ncbi:MAG TPA: hypothetical protein VKZ53_12660 [Candidatus Angelobacter sp.]|nr:hypothetical protein [Candidatus Angelobacter sp.]